MEDNWARQAFDSHDGDGSSHAIGEAAASYADDPLGDEAAFPSTWQRLAGGEADGRN